MEFVAAEKYIQIKYRGWPEHAAAIVTVSLSIGHDWWDIATAVSHEHFSSYTMVRIAPRITAFLCSISSSSERGCCETPVARVSGTEHVCLMVTFCACIVVQIFLH
jgi:hypothetical protein